MAWGRGGCGWGNHGELYAPLQSTHGTETLAAACTGACYCPVASPQRFAIEVAPWLSLWFPLFLPLPLFLLHPQQHCPACGHWSVVHGAAGSGCSIARRSRLSACRELEAELQLPTTRAALVPPRHRARRPPQWSSRPEMLGFFCNNKRHSREYGVQIGRSESHGRRLQVPSSRKMRSYWREASGGLRG